MSLTEATGLRSQDMSEISFWQVSSTKVREIVCMALQSPIQLRLEMYAAINGEK